MTASVPGAGGVAIFRAPADPVARSTAAGWAAEVLRDALRERGVEAQVRDSETPARPTDGHAVIAAGSAAARYLAPPGVALPDAAEALLLASPSAGVTLAAGSDERGLAYALLELADRVRHAADPLAALAVDRPAAERPANAVRGVMRLFSSDVHDKGWFHDPSWWSAYLTELATHRFNRFSLALGLGYDFPRGIRDAYLYFPYPFLLDVPGHAVRVTGLPDGERERNLESLRYIGEEVKRRGLHFQLGLWTHAYEWQDSPDANHTIEGLTPETHAAYCRDAVRLLLREVPTIDGVTFRIHGESGVPERSYDFWETVFAGVASCGRPVEMDLHAKGIDERMIGLALAAGTGAAVNVSPKYWAEHLGPPYHQAEIRELEWPREPAGDRGRWMALSEALRRFTRYGYGDLLREDRAYGVIWRIWPGTQRLLLWGDPLFAAGYGREAHFGGALGTELFEPLSFKGRKGSGVPGHRGGYADAALRPPEGDWAKYRYTYRLFGRLLYDPAADADVWRRYLRAHFGEDADAAERALASASRILPLVTVAHHPSAANYHYWPEAYTDMPIAAPAPARPYSDTPAPKRFGTVSPLDPALFATVEEFAYEVVSGAPSGRYSPLDVARWLDGLAAAAVEAIRRWTESTRRDPATGGGGGSGGDDGDTAAAAEARRWQTDVAIQAELGRFFAGKLRAGVGYALYERTGSRALLRQALDAYRAARRALETAAGLGETAYLPDLTFGPDHWLRGSWRDRLTAIDEDITAVGAALEEAADDSAGPGADRRGAASPSSLSLSRLEERRTEGTLEHTPPDSFRRGEAVEIRVTAAAAVAPHADVAGVRLHYRHVNQAERYEAVEMEPEHSDGAGGGYRATIPAAYADSPYPLQYFFSVRSTDGGAWLSPGLGPDLAGRPYHVLREAREAA